MGVWANGRQPASGSPFQKNTAPWLLALVRMVVCDDVCVWGRVVEGLPEEGEESLKALVIMLNCMAMWGLEGGQTGMAGARMDLQKQAMAGRVVKTGA